MCSQGKLGSCTVGVDFDEIQEKHSKYFSVKGAPFLIVFFHKIFWIGINGFYQVCNEVDVSEWITVTRKNHFFRRKANISNVKLKCRIRFL